MAFSLATAATFQIGIVTAVLAAIVAFVLLPSRRGAIAVSPERQVAPSASPELSTD
jgi:hypothetical protein